MKKIHFIWQHTLQLLLPLILLGYMTTSAHAAELISIKDVTLTDLKDGDSFKVNAAGRELHLRLYYVDCLETTANGFLKDRVLEQKDYFALKNVSTVLDFGKQAAEFTQRVLSRPFTVHTRYAKAPGSSSIRYYAFVETHDGKDLADLLVAHGLARIYGKTSPSPDGASASTVLVELLNLRDTAMLKRAGIWALTDPDREAELRIPYNLNSATSEQLQRIPGIGQVLADRIVAGRPYRSVQEVRNVRGIGRKKLEIIELYVTIARK